MINAIVQENLLRFANKTTKFIAMHWGESFPIYVISEYPKSGGTWLGRMLGDYMGIPFPQHPKMPVAMTCVLHTHWKYNNRLSRCFYLYRDGRDIMVSFYFYRMRAIASAPDSPHSRKMHATYTKLFGDGYNVNNVAENLPIFIDHEMNHPRGARQNWPTHVKQWRNSLNDNCAYLAYEELLDNPFDTLTRVLLTFDNKPIDEQRLHESIGRHSFTRMTGRKQGEEDRGSFIRKGIAGDWKNYFNRHSAEVFDHYAGQTLIDLGYEPDRSWVERC